MRWKSSPEDPRAASTRFPWGRPAKASRGRVAGRDGGDGGVVASASELPGRWQVAGGARRARDVRQDIDAEGVSVLSLYLSCGKCQGGGGSLGWGRSGDKGEREGGPREVSAPKTHSAKLPPCFRVQGTPRETARETFTPCFPSSCLSLSSFPFYERCSFQQADGGCDARSVKARSLRPA